MTLQLDLAVVFNDEAMAVLRPLDRTRHLSDPECVFGVGVATQGPEDHRNLTGVAC